MMFAKKSARSFLKHTKVTEKQTIESHDFNTDFAFLVGVCYWPIIQVINFSFIKERNRVPFVACASFVWTIFLAYMKQLDSQKLPDDHTNLLANSSPFNLVEKFLPKIQLEK